MINDPHLLFQNHAIVLTGYTKKNNFIMSILKFILKRLKIKNTDTNSFNADHIRFANQLQCEISKIKNYKINCENRVFLYDNNKTLQQIKDYVPNKITILPILDCICNLKYSKIKICNLTKNKNFDFDNIVIRDCYSVFKKIILQNITNRKIFYISKPFYESLKKRKEYFLFLKEDLNCEICTFKNIFVDIDSNNHNVTIFSYYHDDNIKNFIVNTNIKYINISDIIMKDIVKAII